MTGGRRARGLSGGGCAAVEETEHLLVAWVPPITDQFDIQFRDRCHVADLGERVVIGIAVEVADDATGVMLDWFEVGRSRGMEERCIEAAAGREHLFHFNQTTDDVICRQMGEDRDRDGPLETFTEAFKAEGFVKQQLRGLAHQPGIRQFLSPGRQERLIDVYAEVTAGVEVVDEMQPAATCTTPDIKQAILSLETL